MYARVTKTMEKPGSAAEDARIFNESVLPGLREQKGFKGVLNLAESETGKGMVITLWETKEDMIASEESGFYQEQAEKFAEITVGAPEREYYEVENQSMEEAA